MTRVRPTSLGGCLGVIGLLAGLAPALAQGPLSTTTGPTVGTRATAFDLTTLEGHSIRLETFRGRPLVINFFATACDPCRIEMPVVQELGRVAYRRGYEVLAIAVEDSAAAVIQYAKDSGWAFTIALDANSGVRRSYFVRGLPATFFIDRDGVLRDRVMGRLTAERARAGLERIGLRL